MGGWQQCSPAPRRPADGVTARSETNIPATGPRVLMRAMNGAVSQWDAPRRDALRKDTLCRCSPA